MALTRRTKPTRPRLFDLASHDDDASTSTSKDPQLPLQAEGALESLRAQPSQKDRFLHLVRLGDELTRRNQQPGGLPDGFEQRAEKVPGCVATVKVLATLDDDAVKVYGTADARVSQGLVALVAEALEGLPAPRVLAVPPDAFAGSTAMASFLTPGRLNGLRSLIMTIQRQIASRVAGVGEEQESETSASAGSEGLPLGPPSFVLSEAAGEVAVLLSGGVDSSVAARLLVDRGERVRAFYLRIWLEDELSHLGECPWEEDLRFARDTCDQLKIPLELVSLQDSYWDSVVRYTISEAAAGRTPNPDVMCNTRVKFGAFCDDHGRHFKRVATGHYAQVRRDQENGPVRLFRSPDRIKDQTYFLCGLSQEQLAMADFPIGTFDKARVRQLARDYSLPTASRRDSQGICFLGKLRWEDFLTHYLGKNPGPIVDVAGGELLGEHHGLWLHTVGQRKGLGPYLRDKMVHRGPFFVVGKDPDTNTLLVTNDYDAIDRPRQELQVESIGWIAGKPPASLSTAGDAIMEVQLRHGPKTHMARVRLLDGDGESAEVHLEEKDSGIAPGQFVAFYAGDECLGGGRIRETWKWKWDGVGGRQEAPSSNVMLLQ
ncbi:unnamed protein product [Vitrella brassicaformis CCMP3155]|uniref:tRNA-5-taurinomethyluridine 2-sulfurtransferase n=2 Tax=Vitrella brassicaformis TaxID=1169539 RepID=A0A0G4FIA7_VITBC|nr:unnamed protein product [Vitrella brassicaformis CCMP3155]|eukprot:CEM13165.1 unnamed protein product [Vitrella brassicaformis CCMP3155]